MSQRDDPEIWEEAERMYDANGARASHPSWDQLGDVTRTVWYDLAKKTIEDRDAEGS